MGWVVYHKICDHEAGWDVSILLWSLYTINFVIMKPDGDVSILLWSLYTRKRVIMKLDGTCLSCCGAYQKICGITSTVFLM
jgi:hypothetical protein